MPQVLIPPQITCPLFSTCSATVQTDAGSGYLRDRTGTAWSYAILRADLTLPYLTLLRPPIDRAQALGFIQTLDLGMPVTDFRFGVAHAGALPPAGLSDATFPYDIVRGLPVKRSDRCAVLHQTRRQVWGLDGTTAGACKPSGRTAKNDTLALLLLLMPGLEFMLGANPLPVFAAQASVA
jgi:hypothetical protein